MMKNSNILVSVCMVTYNHEKFINEAIEGVIMQKTDFQFNLIISDDCSNDKTKEICLEYQQKYPEVIIFNSSIKNKGMYSNFIDNLLLANGKYIAICEGDDYWTDPYKLQKQVDFLEKNEDFSICYHNVKIKREKEGDIVDDYITRQVPEITDIYELAYGNFIHTPSVVFRKQERVFDILKEFSNLPACDYPLHLLNSKYGMIKRIDGKLCTYRVHGSGVWSTKNDIDKWILWIGLLDEIIPLFNDDVIKILNEQKAFYCYLIYKYYRDSEQKEIAEKYFNESIKSSQIITYKNINEEIESQKKNLYRLNNSLKASFKNFKNVALNRLKKK